MPEASNDSIFLKKAASRKTFDTSASPTCFSLLSSHDEQAMLHPSESLDAAAQHLQQIEQLAPKCGLSFRRRNLADPFGDRRASLDVDAGSDGAAGYELAVKLCF